MSTIASRILAALVVAAISCRAGYGLGVKIERGRWLQIEADRGTPLLKLHVSQLRLNPAAPWPRSRPTVLQLVSR